MTNENRSDITLNIHDSEVGAINDFGNIYNAPKSSRDDSVLENALLDLRKLVLAKESLSDEQKKADVELIDKIGEMASSSDSDKNILRILSGSLKAALSVFPEAIKSLDSVVSIISKI